MKKVSDITADHVGKRVRVQTVDGAYVEGTIHGLRAEASARWGEIVKITVTFEELCKPSMGGGHYYTPFETYGNREASEVEEEF